MFGPWQVMSLDGRLGRVVELSVFGQTAAGNETALRLALNALVLERLAAAGIPVGGGEVAA